MDLPDVELSVVLCNNAFIQELNTRFRKENKPTDVLSFPMIEDLNLMRKGMPLGDIVLSLEYAEHLVATSTHRNRVAHELDRDPHALLWSLEHEVVFLLIHSLLHLVGHDHAKPDEETLMKAEERRLFLAIEHMLT